MRKILTFAITVLIVLAVVAGCQKSEPTTTTYTMHADIAGTETYFGNCFVNASYNPAGPSNYIIEAVPDSQNFPSILIGVPAMNVGVYSISSSLSGYYARYFPDSAHTDDAASGQVVITSTSPIVTGSFSFTCTGGTVISKGTFIAKPAN